ncbi:hypothetical protein [Streptomyces acidiscabies]|uniref:Uncharacterized protein n=1 Tax=Streptomyces acidiscabies TaxID=42234 RepID=A0ABU4MBY4_9ACTN|nr:hypothetical protein [Streptomyces acidiscabies]MDX3024960.1 hypothetical protein [Streptomyces acidiscabies]
MTRTRHTTVPDTSRTRLAPAHRADRILTVVEGLLFDLAQQAARFGARTDPWAQLAVYEAFASPPQRTPMTDWIEQALGPVVQRPLSDYHSRSPRLERRAATARAGQVHPIGNEGPDRTPRQPRPLYPDGHRGHPRRPPLLRNRLGISTASRRPHLHAEEEHSAVGPMPGALSGIRYAAARTDAETQEPGRRTPTRSRRRSRDGQSTPNGDTRA